MPRVSALVSFLFLLFSPLAAHARQIDSAGRCPVPYDSTWKPQEIWTWTRLCLHEVADLSELDDKNADLSSDFIQEILTERRYADQLSGSDVTIGGAHITNQLSFSDATINFNVSFVNSSFGLPINFSGSTVSGKFRLLQDDLPGFFSSDSSLGNIFIANSNIGYFEIKNSHVGDVYLAGDSFRNISIDNSKIENFFDLFSDSFSGLLDVEDNQISGPFEIHGRSKDAMANETESKRDSPLSPESSLSIEMEGNTLSGPVVIDDFTIDRNLTANSNSFLNTFTMDRDRINGAVVLQGAYSESVDFVDDSFKSNVDFSGSQFGGDLAILGSDLCVSATRCSIFFSRTNFLNGGLQLTSDNINGELVGEQIDVAKSVDIWTSGTPNLPLIASFNDSNIKHSLSIGHTTLSSLQLSHTMITQDLDLESPGLAGPALNKTYGAASKASPHGDLPVQPLWTSQGSFDFSFGSANSITNKEWEWPPEVNMFDTRYNALVFDDSVDLDHKGCIDGGWVSWFKPEQTEIDYTKAPFYDRIAASVNLLPRVQTLGYHSQPYEELAQVLQNSGQSYQAMCVLETSSEIENTYNSGIQHFAQWLYGVVAGYGYDPWNAAYSLFMVFVGMVVLWVTEQGKSNGMPIGLFYSLSTFVPLVSLDKRFDDVKLSGFARLYFFVHKIFGYVIALFLAAALSGLSVKN